MMTELPEILLAAFLATDLLLAASSRMLHCIRIVTLQGLLLTFLPLTLQNWQSGIPHAELLLVAAVNLAVKCILLPALLNRSMRRAHVRRELEPIVGYAASLVIVLGILLGAFFLCREFNIAPHSVSPLSTPTALTTMLTGLFIIMARHKALTQAIGFLVFENGISIFGIGMMLEYGLVVELGILLDVIVLVFVMGIAVFQISREFEHIDADRLNRLGDRPQTETEVKL